MMPLAAYLPASGASCPIAPVRYLQGSEMAHERLNCWFSCGVGPPAGSTAAGRTSPGGSGHRMGRRSLPGTWPTCDRSAENASSRE
jgi:hypothetical protein